MDSRPIVDKNTGEMLSSPQGSGREFSGASAAGHASSEVRFPGEDGGKSLAEMAQRDLTATLQLLAERAQYITGATGAAIALRDQDEMVCRASAGSSAPEVGAKLQVDSGLSGESIRTRQTLRCDDAFTDPRVNREGCEALGIRSVVVMPLIRGDEVVGVFELFSDKPNIFETRDLAALERMGTMVHTALEHSTAALGLPPMLGEVIQPARAQDATTTLPAPAREHSAEPGPEPAQVDAPRRPTSAASDPPPSSAIRGIAFHGKATAPSTAMPPAPPSKSIPEAVVPAVTSTSAANPGPLDLDEDDILDPPTFAPVPVKVAPKDIPVEVARTSFESLLAEADQDSDLTGVGTAEAQLAAGSGMDSEEAEQDHPLTIDKDIETAPVPVAVPRTAVASLKRCQECGFPVSEGRQLCLDCEKKKASSGTAVSPASVPTSATLEVGSAAAVETAAVIGAPTFMAGADDEASWLSTHKFMVIALVLAAIGIVAAVVLR